VLKALEAPVRQISENAGVEGSIVVGKILENKSETFGFDAQTEEYVDMVETGIIDADTERLVGEGPWAHLEVSPGQPFKGMVQLNPELTMGPDL